MTPLNTTEQLILAGVLGAFVTGAGVIAWQEKDLDRQLAGLEIPKEAHAQLSKTALKSPLAKPRGPVNLNTATLDEMEALPGVGPKLALEIVEYRKLHPFVSVDELDKVPGIGPKKLQKIKDHVRV